MSDFLIPAAYAQTAGGSGGVSGLMSFLPFVAVFAIMYFLLIRPQQQRQKQLKSELKALRRGDRIVTAGGVVGVVSGCCRVALAGDGEAGDGALLVTDTISSGGLAGNLFFFFFFFGKAPNWGRDAIP